MAIGKGPPENEVRPLDRIELSARANKWRRLNQFMLDHKSNTNWQVSSVIMNSAPSRQWFRHGRGKGGLGLWD